MVDQHSDGQLEPLPHSPWTVTASSCVYQNKWSRVIEDTLCGPSNENGLYAYFDTTDCVVICPLFPNRDIMLVRQWRHAFSCSTWELPCGVIEKGETPLAAAQRELAEECQLQAADWQARGSVLPSDARVRGRIHFFLARKLGDVDGQRDDEELSLSSRRVSWTTAMQGIRDQDIEAIASVCFLQRLQQELLP